MNFYVLFINQTVILISHMMMKLEEEDMSYDEFNENLMVCLLNVKYLLTNKEINKIL